MDKGIAKCMDNMAVALKSTREGIDTLRPYKNRRTAIDGTKYDDDVIEVTYENGKTIYVNINCDSNIAAMYDVMSVLMDYKNPIDPKCIEELVPVYD